MSAIHIRELQRLLQSGGTPSRIIQEIGAIAHGAAYDPLDTGADVKAATLRAIDAAIRDLTKARQAIAEVPA